MADKSGISWTDATWPLIAGCDLESPACTNCYAMNTAAWLERIGVPLYAGLTHATKAGPVWNGKINIAPEHVWTQPLRWKRPRRIFLTSMGDVFHPGVTDETLHRAFAIMAAAHWHTFLVLTKRHERMRSFLSDPGTQGHIADAARREGLTIPGDAWPLPNVWAGVTVEDNQRASERLPVLLDTPAVRRWVSNGPALEWVDFRRVALGKVNGYAVYIDALTGYHSAEGVIEGGFAVVPKGALRDMPTLPTQRPALDWIITEGESHKSPAKARPFDLAWARGTLRQARETGAAFWMKQTGSRPFLDGVPYVAPGKGDKPDDWPEDLRVQELPVQAAMVLA